MNILKTLKGPLSTCDKKNRNGRIYSRELWQNVLNSEYWKDMMKNNSLCGEVVHPGDERQESDSFEIDISKVSHRIKEAHLEGDKLMGTIEILDTEQGRNLLSLVDAGVTVGISARGVGDVNGDEVDPYTYNLKTFDITLRPSDPNARLIPLTESERLHFKFINESEESDELIKGSEDLTINKDNGEIEEITKQLATAINERNKADGYPVTQDKLDNFKFVILPTTSDSSSYSISIYDKKKNNMAHLGPIRKDKIDNDLLNIIFTDLNN